MINNKFTIVSLIYFACLLGSCESGKDSKELKVEKVSIEEIAAGIKAHISAEEQKNNGYFYLPTDSGDLKLKLVRVHMEYLSNLGPAYNFACVDLADVSGEVFDVDFFMKGEPGNMRVTETTIHKLNGKPFYSWKQKEDKTWYKLPMEESSEDLLGVVEGVDRFEFYYTLKLPEIKDKAKMWLPVPIPDEYQAVVMQSFETSNEGQVIYDSVYRNEILYFDLGPGDSGKEIKLTYNVERKEKSAYEVPDEGMYQFLEGESLLPVGGRFSEIVDQVLAGKKNDNDLVKARALYDYIIDNMKYQKAGMYGTGDADYACDSKSGNCTEFHSLFISLARTAQIPARFAIGAAIPSNRSEGGVDGYHCWAEFYAEGKWWPVDISEGNKYTALATYYFGHHPANRLELSRGRNLIVNPMPVSGPIKFLAYPLFEMGGEEVKVETKFSFKRL